MILILLSMITLIEVKITWMIMVKNLIMVSLWTPFSFYMIKLLIEVIKLKKLILRSSINGLFQKVARVLLLIGLTINLITL